MRRILFTVLAAAALCVAAPAAALAHNGHRGHHHKRHHRLRHEFFKAHPSDTSTSGGSTGSTSQPSAGTVTSFANNVLTITLANGNTVSGDVTSDSEIKCENPDNANGDNDADDNGAGDEHGDAVFHHSDGGGDNGGWNGGGDQGGDQGGDNGNSQTCTPTAGMAVRSAELTVNGNGAFWNEVELVNSSTSTTTSQS